MLDGETKMIMPFWCMKTMPLNYELDTKTRRVCDFDLSKKRRFN